LPISLLYNNHDRLFPYSGETLEDGVIRSSCSIGSACFAPPTGCAPAGSAMRALA
jgi:hypothetical protein